MKSDNDAFIKIPIKLKPSQISEKYHRNDLITKSFLDLQKFTYNGLLAQAKVVEIYDGDTITIVFYHNDLPMKHNFRLKGCDAPEMHPKKIIENRELHIKAANLVKNKLSEMILNQIVWIRFCQEEKYGRLMGTIYLINNNNQEIFVGDEININDWIVKNGFAKSYDGNKKQEYKVEELTQIIARCQ